MSRNDAVTVIGMDPSLCNWGLCRGTVEHGHLSVDTLAICQPKPDRAIARSLDDLRRVSTLLDFLGSHLDGNAITVVEIPSGTQSARGMFNYGMIITTLAFLKKRGFAPILVTPWQVKKIATGNPEASKEEMIAWATSKFPDAPWPVIRRNGHLQINASKAEHTADAVAIAYAGITLNPHLFSGEHHENRIDPR